MDYVFISFQNHFATHFVEKRIKKKCDSVKAINIAFMKSNIRCTEVTSPGLKWEDQAFEYSYFVCTGNSYIYFLEKSSVVILVLLKYNTWQNVVTGVISYRVQFASTSLTLAS